MNLSPINKSMVVQLKSIANTYVEDEDNVVRGVGMILKQIASMLDDAPDRICGIYFGYMMQYMANIHESIIEVYKAFYSKGGCQSCGKRDSCNGHCETKEEDEE